MGLNDFPQQHSLAFCGGSVLRFRVEALWGELGRTKTQDNSMAGGCDMLSPGWGVLNSKLLGARTSAGLSPWTCLIPGPQEEVEVSGVSRVGGGVSTQPCKVGTG